MTWFPDMKPLPIHGDVRNMLAVGWLHPDHPFHRGVASPEFVSRLRRFQGLAKESSQAFGLLGGLGDHDCEFCDIPDVISYPDYTGHGYICVPCKAHVLVAPEMLPHYVETHGYEPPAEFMSGIMKSPLPGTAAYLEAADRFLIKPLLRNANKPPLLERVAADMKSAMKARDALRVSTLRLILSDVTNHHIEKGLDLPLSDDDVLQVLNRAISLRREAMEEFQRGGRPDLAEKEEREARLLQEYLR